MEPFITTFTGQKVNPLALRLEDIDIRDIAHHQALINRFVGATVRPITLAQHSVYVSRLLDGTGWEREGLFHDAAEAYLGDVSKWVKRSPEMRGYRLIEDAAWEVICKALNLRAEGDPQINGLVREADSLMVRYEALRGMSNPQHLFVVSSHPCPNEVEINRVGPWGFWTWRESERLFLDRARSLGFRIPSQAGRKPAAARRTPGRTARPTPGRTTS